MNSTERQEIRRFSIDPYINAGGNFGTRMAVNEDAATRILTASKFERDIFVAKKRPEREDHPEVHGDTLALKRIAFPRFTVKSAPLHDIQKTRTTFTIGINDETLQEQADAATAKRYKRHQDMNGHTILQGEFIGRFNHEVVSGVRSALRDEKIQGIPGYMIMGSFLMNTEVMIIDPNLGNGIPLFVLIFFKAVDEYATNISRGYHHRGMPSPLAYAKGLTQIQRNKNHLIVEKATS